MNGWSINTVNAAGGTSSEATVIVRDSPWMVVNVITSEDLVQRAVHLPISPTFGDLVEVSVGLGSSLATAQVWLGTTVIGSSTTHVEGVDPGRSRLYRYISGPFWNRFD